MGIHGFDLYTEYTISLRISSADPYRYKFFNMQWVAVEESEIMQNEDRQLFCHTNSLTHWPVLDEEVNQL